MGLDQNRQHKPWNLLEVQPSSEYFVVPYNMGLRYLVHCRARRGELRDGKMEDLDHGEIHLDVHRNSGHLGCDHHNAVLL